MAFLTWNATREPVVGDHRTVKRFLFLPLSLRGESRWLGIERVRQEWVAYRIPLKRACGSFTSYKWVNVEWAE